MALAFLLALQVAASPAPPAPGAIDLHFDLGRLQPLDDSPGVLARTCPRQTGEEIVVCGYRSRAEPYPFDEMARLFEPRPLVAETRLLGDVTGAAYVEGVQFPNGMISNRVMVGVRLPF